MSRKVFCMTDSGRPLPEDECDLHKKPTDEKTCSQDNPCTGTWFTGPWSKVRPKLLQNKISLYGTREFPMYMGKFFPFHVI